MVRYPYCIFYKMNTIGMQICVLYYERISIIVQIMKINGGDKNNDNSDYSISCMQYLASLFSMTLYMYRLCNPSP